VKLGLFINTQFQPGESVRTHLPDLVTQVRTARDAGFTSLWFPHHYLTGPMQMLQIVPMMAYLAPHAEGMQMGPNILLLPLLSPVHVAEEAATLDVLTGGNFILGVGLGYREGEFIASNVPMKERAARAEESIPLLRRLWSGERVTHHGRFYHVENEALSLQPVRPGGVPIWMGATVEASIRRAARIADAWLIDPTPTLDRLASHMRIYREALHDAGKPDQPSVLMRECYVGANQATALAECRGALEYKYNAYSSWGMAPSQKPAFEDYVRNRFLIGDATFVKEEIARYREALGIDHLIVRCHWPGLAFDKAIGSIERLGKIVG
jgi:alkanesulfonate monooxygenase SsuD/methylene tetrahydromethanopterin reductase-like flavin-dependent oxidoreductase (luciferase family)